MAAVMIGSLAERNVIIGEAQQESCITLNFGGAPPLKIAKCMWPSRQVFQLQPI